jgi:type IV secretion system protein VirB9
MTRPVTLLTTVALLAVTTAASAQTAREVGYSPQSIVALRAKLRYTTMVILPEQEEILDFVCGDKEFWVVSGAQNLAYIKPAKAGVSTNLNLVTASGRVYSFVLTEGGGDPDLKVFVSLDEAMAPRSGGQPRLFSAAQVDEFRREAEDARRDADDARKQLDAAREAAEKTIDERVSAFRASFPTELKFPYRYKANAKPFNVSAIYTDGRFTYIRAGAAELPALYELIENGASNTPNLINFQVENGVYIVPKVLERGYLAIGKQKLEFETVR